MQSKNDHMFICIITVKLFSSTGQQNKLVIVRIITSAINSMTANNLEIELINSFKISPFLWL